MDINLINTNRSKLFSSPGPVEKNVQAQELTRIERVGEIRQSTAITPQNYNLGAVSQLVNSKYLFELRKDIKRVLKGRKLAEFFDHEFTEEEFDELPKSLQNLLVFNRKISSAEVLEFIENIDDNHQITFRDYAFNRIKFRALFEALGNLIDVEMLAGNSTYVPLSTDFKVKRKVTDIFNTLGDKIKGSLGLKKKKDDTARND
jgi:hypothetical protein